MSQAVASRYAAALFSEAGDKSATDAVDASVASFLETVEGSADLRSFFASPVISRDKKSSVVDKLFKDKVDPTFFNLLKLLVSKGREGLASQVAEAYQGLRNDQTGTVVAQVRTAVDLNEAETEKLKAGLADLTGKNVSLSMTTDDSLIGGLIVRIGDKVYDGSLRNQLTKLRRQLDEGSARLN